jgi:cellulose synthase/poly-beta-1,6-N-acetylglucosamine synthase-like glycosyltransferase
MAFNAIEYVIITLFLGYMLITTCWYLALNGIAMNTLFRYMQVSRDDDNELLLSGNEPPISLIIPAYNEASTIISSIRSLQQLYYSDFELIVVNDGSSDATLEVLREEFDLIPFPEAFNIRIPTQPIKQVYVSRKKHNLRVLDKENGGKADALNAGINVSRYPLVCCVDADSILERYSLLRVVQPFINNPEVVACGGTVRIANGCTVRSGHLVRKGLPRNPLALLQLLEYLRGFLYGRIGWARLNGLLIISGAFGMLRKDAIIKIGGYDSQTVGEDMELIVRLHRILSAENVDYRVEFIPDPICWTEVPEKLRVFASQRVRWHRGLSESLWMNRGLLFSRHSGPGGWLAFPFFILFEWMSPFVEILGYVFTLYLIIMGKVHLSVALLFFLFAIGLSVLLSTNALLLDEITFRGISKVRHLPVLFACSFLECIGYRQINAYYRIIGALKWLTGSHADWGKMVRSGSWQRYKS